MSKVTTFDLNKHYQGMHRATDGNGNWIRRVDYDDLMRTRHGDLEAIDTLRQLREFDKELIEQLRKDLADA